MAVPCIPVLLLFNLLHLGQSPRILTFVVRFLPLALVYGLAQLSFGIVVAL